MPQPRWLILGMQIPLCTRWDFWSPAGIFSLCALLFRSTMLCTAVPSTTHTGRRRWTPAEATLTLEPLSVTTVEEKEAFCHYCSACMCSTFWGSTLGTFHYVPVKNILRIVLEHYVRYNLLQQTKQHCNLIPIDLSWPQNEINSI